MSLEEIYYISQIIAVLAILASLIFVAFQVRHSAEQTKLNTHTISSQSKQMLINGWADTQAELVRDPELLKTYANAITRWPDVSDLEKAQFDLSMGQFLSNLQNGINLHKAGLIDEETLETTASFMLTVLRSEGGARWWADTAFAWPETRTYLEKRLSQTGDRPKAEDIAPHWMALAKEG